VTENHFDYLMNTYLPRHGGAFWKEGDAAASSAGMGESERCDAANHRFPAAGYSQM